MASSPLYSAIYFWKARKVAAHHQHQDLVTMQFFQRHDHAKLCGIEHVLQTIKRDSDNYQALTVYALADGAMINAEDIVLTITGHYEDFAFLEGKIDGILASETTVCTNSYRVVQAAQSRPVIYMNDRNSYIETQKYDGYAAYIGGIRYFTSHEQVKLIPQQDDVIVIGSIPHSLIQLHTGNLVQTMQHYHAVFGDEPLTALVDYHNNTVVEAVKLAKAFPELSAVRLDTSPHLVDEWLAENYRPLSHEQWGVNATLVKALRQALDDAGFSRVKIIVSSGLNPQRIEKMMTNDAPVDWFGVGFYLSTNKINFTGDSVLLNQKPEAKTGRKSLPNPRLKQIDWSLVKIDEQ